MVRMYSYRVRYDYGSAPNFGSNVLTLAICKPDIRLHASVGDLIVGIDKNRCVVYTMRVSQKVTFKQYDELAKVYWPEKIPDLTSPNPIRWVGDCIYDYCKGSDPILRHGPHDESERIKDLRGKYVLISNDFYYFGDRAIPLPESLPIDHPHPGYRSNKNAPYLLNFEMWLAELGLASNTVYGYPQHWMWPNFEISSEQNTQTKKCKSLNPSTSSKQIHKASKMPCVGFRMLNIDLRSPLHLQTGIMEVCSSRGTR